MNRTFVEQKYWNCLFQLYCVETEHYCFQSHLFILSKQMKTILQIITIRTRSIHNTDNLTI